MKIAEFSKVLSVLFQYGLLPIYWEGDLLIIQGINNKRMVFSGGLGDEVPDLALATILEHVGMDEGAFWQYYYTI